jgi:hypothetical protein
MQPGGTVPTSKPITWIIADIIQWYKNKELIVNDRFQRHSVWNQQAKTLLIDTILNELPLPKIFIRTKIDSKRQKTVKEIVDGQQRVRSIVEFANNEFALNKKSEHYHDMYYRDLPDDIQEQFLGYVVTAEQLLNATDDDIIDIFARLNSYTVPLNATEKRHAAFQTELKFFVRKSSVKFRWFIEKYNIFTIKQRFRMADDEFFAEIIRLITDGISDGGSEQLNKYYRRMTDDKFDDTLQKSTEAKLEELITFLDSQLDQFLTGPLGKHYQIYALCAAYLIIDGTHQNSNIVPSPTGFKPQHKFADALSILEQDLDDDLSVSEFSKASRSSTQRQSTRIARTKAFVTALTK